MDHPAATPVSPPIEVAPNLFAVYGSIRVNPLVRFTRTMAVVRHHSELTLISTVRLDDAGLAALDKLGEVKHVVRLGPLHGLDDPFYVDRYNARFWTFPGGTTYTRPTIAETLHEGGALPFADAQLFEFRGIKQPEGAILLKQGAGVLITVDAIQSYATYPFKPHTNLLARLLLPLMGFPNKTLVGPIWTKLMTDDKAALRAEFDRLMNLQFDQLLSAHGTFLPAGAHAAVAAAIEERFSA